MPSSLNTSSVVSKATKTRKCKKPCQSSSSSSCCTEQCVDCCSSQYQTLSLLRNLVAANQVQYAGTTALWNVSTAGTNRCGELIPEPSTTGGGAYDQQSAYSGGCTSENRPTDLNSGDLEVANLSYYFVNEFAYGPYEPGCHNDQVYGWYVNLQSGELQLFTTTDSVPTQATRLCLSSLSSPSSTQRKQLKVLNKLFKLSKSAVKEVNGIPSQAGNIVEVCDCKGERWLLYIDTAAAQDGNALECNYEFAVVATKLC